MKAFAQNISCTIFSLIFLFFSLFAGLFLFAEIRDNLRLISGGEKLSAVVSELIPQENEKGNILYKSEVTFTGQDGEEHVITLPTATQPARHEIGQKIEIYYSKNHQTIGEASGSMWIGTGMLSFFTLLFFTIGILPIYGYIRRSRLKQLRNSGIKTAGKIEDIRESRVTVNNRTGYVVCISATHPVTKETAVYESERLEINPFAVNKDQLISIYFDRNNTKRYFVDLTEKNLVYA